MEPQQFLLLGLLLVASPITFVCVELLAGIAGALSAFVFVIGYCTIVYQISSGLSALGMLIVFTALHVAMMSLTYSAVSKALKIKR